jgi:hypothetical protein
VKTYLTKKYGKPDTIALTFVDRALHYKAPGMSIQVEDGNLIAHPKYGAVYETAIMRVLAKNYDAQLDSITAVMKKNARPEDIVEIRFKDLELSRQRHGNGMLYPAIQITSNYEGNNSVFESRAIESIKGDLQIVDRFGDVVFKQEGLEYTPHKPIRRTNSGTPEYGKSWTLFLVNRPELNELREAVTLHKELKVQFKPKAVYFTDGTILK